MRRHNGRLFRAARAILKDDAEAEDAVQDAYLDAYRHMAEFRGDSQVGTWLVRIAVNQALMRLRKHKRESVVVSFDRPEPEDSMEQLRDEKSESPMAATLRAEIRRLLERRIDELPMTFRAVFVLREVEEMSVEETAAALGIPAATVRTRLFRARALLRQALDREMDLVTGDVFGFAGARCDRIVAAVLAGTSLQPLASNGQEGIRMKLSGLMFAGVLALAPVHAQSINDAQIAHIVVTANQVDIDAGKVGRTMASNAEVKKFAEQMIADHEGVNKQAVALATKLKVTPEDNDTSTSLKAGGDKNVATLKALKGAAFDKAYVNQEVAYHQAVLDAIDQTLIPGASNAELKALIVRVRPAIAAHLEHAKHIQASLGK